MTQRNVILAIEDPLGEAVSMRILANLDNKVSQRLGLNGKEYLKEKAHNLNQTARGFAVFMLTDQDTADQCPLQLIRSWVKGRRHPRFFLRVATMEVESWILADQKGIANLLSIPLSRIPVDTDALPQPKEFLVSLARRSNRTRIRAELVPKHGATSKVGPAYNLRLGEFVRHHSNIERASKSSNSLKRTLARLGQHFQREVR